MDLFESPAWDVDKSAKVLSEKFGEVRGSRKRKEKKQNLGLKSFAPETVDLKKKSDKKKSDKFVKKKGKFPQTNNSVKFSVHDAHAFEKSPVISKKIKSENVSQPLSVEGQRESKVDQKKKKQKNREKHKEKVKNVKTYTQNVNKRYLNPHMMSGEGKSVSSDPARSNSILPKPSEGGEKSKQIANSQVPSNKKNKNLNISLGLKKKGHKENVNLKARKTLKVKRNQIGNVPRTEKTESTVSGNAFKFQGSLKNVITSNVYTSHSVKNKKEKLIKKEKMDHSLLETKAKSNKSFASRLLKYASHKKISLPSQDKDELFEKDRKRKHEGDLTSNQPFKKMKHEQFSAHKTLETTGSLRERLLNQLKSSRFRYINEQLYTTSGSNAQKMFMTDPESFYAYHEGYQQQVSQWPMNPLDRIIKSIKKKSATLVVADFGCGDAKLAKSLPNKVYSFDLVAISNEVTVCDMAHTPLPDSSIDIAVFCLSLMGTDLASYIQEANRVLKLGGTLKIADVASRFENVEFFSRSLKKYGFSLKTKDLSNNLFYFMDFKKENSIKNSKKCPPLSLKPCYYKKR